MEYEGILEYFEDFPDNRDWEQVSSDIGELAERTAQEFDPADMLEGLSEDEFVRQQRDELEETGSSIFLVCTLYNKAYMEVALAAESGSPREFVDYLRDKRSVYGEQLEEAVENVVDCFVSGL